MKYEEAFRKEKRIGEGNKKRAQKEIRKKLVQFSTGQRIRIDQRKGKELPQNM